MRTGAAASYNPQGASRKVRIVRLRPDSSSSGPAVAREPAPTTTPAAPGSAVTLEKHLHPALLAALRRRIAQAAGHPGIPYH
jgi:hypothetical protein